MALEMIGKLVQKLQEEGGTSASTGKNWRKQSFVLETLDAQYPKKICFTLWGDKVEILNSIADNTIVTVFFDVESREYMNKWYSDIKAYRIDINGNPVGGQTQNTQQNSNTQNNNTAAPRQEPKKFTPATDEFAQDTKTDDLPF
jgi:hypothetical protein